MAVYKTEAGVTVDQYRSAVGVPRRHGGSEATRGLKAHRMNLADDMAAYGAVLDGRYKDGGQTNWETLSAPPPTGA